jgi:hypothetical protein
VAVDPAELAEEAGGAGVSPDGRAIKLMDQHAEHTQLMRHGGAARNGESRALVVRGDAGMGKTAWREAGVRPAVAVWTAELLDEIAAGPGLSDDEGSPEASAHLCA